MTNRLVRNVRGARWLQGVSFAAWLLLCTPFIGASAWAADDTTDHPLLSRIAGISLTQKSVQQFGVLKVSVAGNLAGGASEASYEGKITTLDYATTEGSPPGEVKIYRNHLAAVQKQGGRPLNSGFDANDSVSLVTGAQVFALPPLDHPVIAVLNIANAYNYRLTIVEPEAMDQSVKAGQLATQIKDKGVATLHIQFDTNKAVLKDDGVAAVKQVAQLLKDDPALKLSIEGHTDNVGSAASNQTLSQDRARAVMNAVVAQGIDAKRLGSKGLGATVPVADNRTDEGRAQNRRVELVKVK